MSTIIDSIERRQLRRVPRFDPGDRVRVHFQVIEGTRRRTQVFEGIVIARQGSGARETFTVRKQSFGVGVERMFPLHSPKIDQLEVVARGDVRRAKLYYLRGRVGKRARVAERAWSGEVEEAVMPEAEAVDGDAAAIDQTPVAPGEIEYEEPPEEAEPVEYEPPAEEPINEGAAVVPSDAEGAQEATADDLKAAEEAAQEPEADADEGAEAPGDEDAGDADEAESEAADAEVDAESKADQS